VLHEFIAINRDEIISRCRAKVSARSTPPSTEAEIDHGVPVFLDQLTDALRLGLTTSPEISTSAIKHGHDLLRQGFTVSQVVHDYGDVCQSITELAVELDAPISTDHFRTLNRCLDDAIAGYAEFMRFGTHVLERVLKGDSPAGDFSRLSTHRRLRFLRERIRPVLSTEHGRAAIHRIRCCRP